MARVGLEQDPDSPKNIGFSESASAHSDALSRNFNLQAALDAFAKLTPEQRAALAGMLRGSEGGSRSAG